MEAVYPRPTSALVRGRRARRRDPRLRHRTTPVTFAEIKEVDEEGPGEGEGEGEVEDEQGGVQRGRSAGGEERRRRPDLLDERLGRQFAEFRGRRARREGALRELSPPSDTLHRARSHADILTSDTDTPAPVPRRTRPAQHT